MWWEERCVRNLAVCEERRRRGGPGAPAFHRNASRLRSSTRSESLKAVRATPNLTRESPASNNSEWTSIMPLSAKRSQAARADLPSRSRGKQTVPALGSAHSNRSVLRAQNSLAALSPSIVMPLFHNRIRVRVVRVHRIRVKLPTKMPLFLDTILSAFLRPMVAKTSAGPEGQIVV